MTTVDKRSAAVQRRGELTFLARLRLPDETGCMVWMGPLDIKGDHHAYGVQGDALAHRRAYEHFVGPIPEGLVIDHLCRNTLCCAPAHLEPVTQDENVRRGLNGELFVWCKHGHEMTPANTYYRKDRPGWRQCRRCKANRERKRQRRIRERQVA